MRLSLALPFWLALAAPATAAPASAVPALTGVVGPANAARFLDAVSDRAGKTVRLHVVVRRSTDADFKRVGYLTSVDNRLFTVTGKSADASVQGIEVSAGEADAPAKAGGFALDGDFAVEEAGMNQGIAAYHLRRAPPSRGAVFAPRPL